MMVLLIIAATQSWSIHGVSASPPPGVDMNRIVYVAAQQDTLGFVDADGSHNSTLALDPTNQGTKPDISAPELSPDGSTVLFTYTLNLTDLCQSGLSTVNVDGTGLTDVPTPQAAGCTIDGVWSPDGSKIAFVSAGTSSAPGLWVENRDGTNAIHLVNMSTNPGPQWSPDGSRIVFTDGAQLDWISSAGGAITQLTHLSGTSVEYPSWSPNGSNIEFVATKSAAGAATAMLFNLATSHVSVLFPIAQPIGATSWSPDSNHLLMFSTTNPGVLSIVNLRGVVISSVGAGGIYPNWIRVQGVPGGGASVVGISASTLGSGYRVISSDGGIVGFGQALFYGSTGGIPINKPIVALVTTPDGGGYWITASDGGVFSFGDAIFYGSTGSVRLNQPIVGMASTSDGNGYWLVARDGGVFSFGDAQFHGSTGSMALNKQVVAMAATSDGGGYWLVASDGGIFAFGDAQFHGSTGSYALNKPVVGMAATSDDGGYWLVASDGGIFTFGGAQFFGSTGALRLNKPMVGMAQSLNGQGYWLIASDGGIFSFGGAPFYGSSA
jgi:dipeptidyl aminopeptidase/acylaminoacyl peptidase